MNTTDYFNYGRAICSNLLDLGENKFIQATLGVEPFATFNLDDVLQQYSHLTGNMMIWISPSYRISLPHQDRPVRTVEGSYILLTTSNAPNVKPDEVQHNALLVCNKINGFIKKDFEERRCSKNVFLGCSIQPMTNIGGNKLHGQRVYWSFTEIFNSGMQVNAADWIQDGNTGAPLIPYSNM